MKKVLFSVFILTIISCQKQVRTSQNETTLNNFFERCNYDIKNAAETISSKKLVSALYHLNRMNNGGSHYYILEKEATTEMINKLATYTYSECLLITISGKIIYTMYDNSLLGKSIYSLPGKPFDIIVEKSLYDGPAISDSVNFVTKNGNSNNLTFAYPVFEGSERKGVMITSVPTKYLKEEMAENTYIVDENGIIRYHPDESLCNSTDIYFTGKNSEGVSRRPVGTVKYTRMTFETITWFIATDSRSAK